ncbi:MAG: hypothetical protein JWP69_493 [Flaviaesturariibacter sp.]|nr:hypothetical protein [Flaviaesturariibacter sp.]
MLSSIKHTTMSKLFDLRFVIGAFFIIVSILLLIHRFTSGDDPQHINKWCAIAFAIFGVLMVVLSLGKDAGDELIEESKD